jgi:hypothetical protein
MAWVRNLGSRLRAILILILLFGIVVVDSVSRIISMCADGFLAVLLFLLIWPLIKKASPAK